MAKVQKLDTTSGAPLKVRAVVGNFDDPDRRLKALQEYYPDAVPYGDDNFIFTSEDGVPTVYNNESWIPDVGDFVSVGRDVTSMITGGLAGTGAFIGGQLGPQAFTPEELVTVPAAVALGGEAGGQLYDRVIDMFVPEVGRGGLVDQSKKAATNIAGEMVGGKLVQKGSELIGKVPGAFRRGLAGGEEYAGNISKAIARGENIGADIGTVGVASQSPILMGIEKRLAQMPFSANRMNQVFERIYNSSSKLVDDLSKRYSPNNQVVSKENIGSLIKKEAQTATEKFNLKTEQMYDEAFALAPDARGRVSNVMELREKFKVDLAKAPESLGPSMTAAFAKANALINDSINVGGIDLQSLRKIRTNLRKQLGDLTRTGRSEEETALLDVYDALTKDIYESVQGTNALDAMKKADKYVFNVSKKIVPLLDEVLSKDEIQVYNLWTSGSKDGLRNFKKILNNVKGDARDELKAKFIRNLGYAKPAGVTDDIEEFSTATFLTKWDNLSNEAKSALFGNKSNPVWSDLDDILKSFNALKASDSYTNYSKTGDTIMSVAAFTPIISSVTAVGAGAMDIGTGALISGASVVTPKVASRLMTNPIFIRWLAKSGSKLAQNPNSLSFHVGRLIDMSTQDTQFRDDVADYVQSLTTNLLGSSAEASVINQEVPIDASQSGALTNILSSTDSSARKKILDAANIQ